MSAGRCPRAVRLGRSLSAHQGRSRCRRMRRSADRAREPGNRHQGPAGLSVGTGHDRVRDVIVAEVPMEELDAGNFVRAFAT